MAQIIVGSANALKIQAVRDALSRIGIQAKVDGIDAISNVSEQPFDSETKIGALNRALYCQSQYPEAFFWIGIENGLFETEATAEGAPDKAVVLALFPDGQSFFKFSEGVIFPRVYIEEAKKIGFDKITVGQVMVNAGFVKNAKDPHSSLGKARQVILTEALVELFSDLKQQNRI